MTEPGGPTGAEDGLLRSVEVDRHAAQLASSARMTSSFGRRGPWIGFAVVAAVGAVIGVRSGGGIVALVLTPLAAVLVALWLLNRAALKSVKATYPVTERVSLEPTLDGFTLRTRQGSWSTTWAEYAAVDVVRGHLVLRRKGTGALVLVPGLWGEDTVSRIRAAGVPVEDRD